MKPVTFKDGSRDGQLVLAPRDPSGSHYATGIANQLQAVLNDWNFMASQLSACRPVPALIAIRWRCCTAVTSAYWARSSTKSCCGKAP